MAFELLTRDEELETIWQYVREEIKRYANENRYDVRRQLYKTLTALATGTPVYKRIIYILQAIRDVASPLNVTKSVSEPENSPS